MPRLRYFEKTGNFVLWTDDHEAAREAGLTRSTSRKLIGSCGPGETVYFTDVPYAVLHLWDHGDEAARDALSWFRERALASRATAHDLDPPAPRGRTYMPFQRAGIWYALQQGNTLIGDAPGVGKTIEAIGVCNAVEAQRVLVVCPANVRWNWRREILAWSTIEPRPKIYPIMKSSDGVNPFSHYVVVSYDLTRNGGIHDAIMALEWDVLVLDEAHYLKSPDARRTRAVFGGKYPVVEAASEDGAVGGAEGGEDPGGDVEVSHRLEHRPGIADRARRVLALTGTPLPNRPRECYTLARGLQWDSLDFLSLQGFKDRFNPSFWGDERTGRLPELQARLRCSFMVRRELEDVLKDLPETRYELAYVEENGAIRKAIAHERLLDLKPEDLEKPDFKILGMVSTVRREMGEAKVPRVVEHVLMLLDGGLEKVVVFAHHRSVIAALEEKLGRYGCVGLSGKTPQGLRKKVVDTFRDDPTCRVFIGQLQAAGVGIDGLQHATSHAVFAEASWVPGENEQCVGRLRRHGQQWPVLAQFLVAPGSLDERVLGSMIDKNHKIHAALDKR